MKTKDELKELKDQILVLNTKLKELDEEELKEITGGKLLPCFAGDVVDSISDIICFENNTIDTGNDIHGGIIFNNSTVSIGNK